MADDVAEDPATNPLPRWTAASGDLSPHRRQLRRLADAGREVIERMASVDVSEASVERAAELLEAVVRELEGPGKVRRYDGFAESANAGGDPHAHFDHSPIMGMANPIAPPVRIEAGGGDGEGESITMHVRFGSAYEGPPASVHGGVLAAMFDELLGMTQSLSGQPGMTGTLSIRYRRPTPLHRDLRFVGTLERVEGRKIFTRGRCYVDDQLTCEAEGLFIRVDFAKISAMMVDRDRAAD